MCIHGESGKWGTRCESLRYCRTEFKGAGLKCNILDFYLFNLRITYGIWCIFLCILYIIVIRTPNNILYYDIGYFDVKISWQHDYNKLSLPAQLPPPPQKMYAQNIFALIVFFIMFLLRNRLMQIIVLTEENTNNKCPVHHTVCPQITCPWWVVMLTTPLTSKQQHMYRDWQVKIHQR